MNIKQTDYATKRRKKYTNKRELKKLSKKIAFRCNKLNIFCVKKIETPKRDAYAEFYTRRNETIRARIEHDSTDSLQLSRDESEW